MGGACPHRLVTPASVKGTVAPPRRKPNAELRSREHLTEAAIERLMKAAGDNRHSHRDRTMLLLAFRRGLRATELVALKWDQVDLAHGKLHVNRVKNGSPSTHPLTGVELRALRKLQRESPPFGFTARLRLGAEDVRQRRWE
jgi:integrase